jgi:hypothetical protein
MGRDPEALVFAQIDGDPIQPDSVTKMFARIVARARVHSGQLPRTAAHPRDGIAMRWRASENHVRAARPRVDCDHDGHLCPLTEAFIDRF